MHCIYNSEVQGSVGYCFVWQDEDQPKKEFQFKDDHEQAE